MTVALIVIFIDIFLDTDCETRLGPPKTLPPSPPCRVPHQWKSSVIYIPHTEGDMNTLNMTQTLDKV